MCVQASLAPLEIATHVDTYRKVLEQTTIQLKTVVAQQVDLLHMSSAVVYVGTT
jgi:hypothetical protein